MNRPGTVLVLALLAVLAMELIALSAFGFARIAGLGASSGREHVLLQVAADDVLASGVASLDAFDVASRPVGARWSVPTSVVAPSGTSSALTAVRPTDHLVILNAEATSRRGMRVQSRGLLRIVPSTAVLQGFPAVVTTILPAGPTDTAEASDSTSCAGAVGPLPPTSLLPWFTRSWADSLVFGDAAGLMWQDAEVLAVADVAFAEPDSARFLLVNADSAITGAFRGIIVAQGDLRLAAGSDVRGLVSVRGELTIEPGATLGGAVRTLALQDFGGRFVYDRCAVAQALGVAPLRRAYRAGMRWRVPAF